MFLEHHGDAIDDGWIAYVLPTRLLDKLIDEACGRVIDTIAERGWLDDTDTFLTTDHGELQGDFGLMYKGPFHVDALMRLSFIWRPAPSSGPPTCAVVTDPVGAGRPGRHVCAIAGVATPDWIQDESLPIVDGAPGRERMVCEWDSQFPGYGMHLRSVHTVRGGDGNDTIYGDIASATDASTGEADVRLDGDAGNDTIYGDFFAQATGITEGTGMSGWADTISGDKGNDLIYGQSSDDVIHGNEGGDVISGQAGWDLLLGDAGTDVVRGGPGGDVLHGGTINNGIRNTLIGDTGADCASNGLDKYQTPSGQPTPDKNASGIENFGVCPDPPR